MNCTTYDNGQFLGTVEGKIHAIISTLQTVGEDGKPDIEYRYCNWAQANVALDRIDRPTIIYVLPPSGILNFGWNQVKDSPNAQIAFIIPTDFDFDGEENEDLIEQMKRLSIRFIQALNESGMFDQIEGNVPYRVLYDHLDQNVTGIIIEPTLKEEEGIWICCDPGVRKFMKIEDSPETDNEESNG